jgi:hypothetical protein
MKFFLKCIKSIILILFNYHTYKTNIFKNKASDIIFILGSGSSINNFKFWNCVKKKDSIGFNFFLFHKFIPNFYIFETPNINNNNQFKSQLELIDYKLSKNAGYRKVQFFLKIRPGYSQISKIFKKNKINFSTILDFNFNLKKKKFIKFIRNKFFFLFNYFFLCGHGVGTLEKICLKAFFSGYKSIVLCGVDLNNTNYFKGLIENHFTVIKTFDGCKADIVIKKKNENKDLWLGIQVKTTNKKTDRDQYYFRLNSGKYDNCIILCICDEDKKMWLIPYEEVEGFKTIGIAQKSKYNKYEVNKDNLIEKINNYYELSNKFCFDILDTPTSNSHKQEQEFRKIRESKINFIEFKNNDIEGLVYDFMIGNKKIQEKVGSITHDNINSYCFTLSKHTGRINGKCIHGPYEEGDNDLYWLNCKNNLFCSIFIYFKIITNLFNMFHFMI